MAPLSVIGSRAGMDRHRRARRRAAVTGVVLEVRNLSQQGLFLIGGSAADRLGARGVIIAGCALRTAGFALFAFGATVPLLLAAAVLSGLAGALFNPAVRAYVAVAAWPTGASSPSPCCRASSRYWWRRWRRPSA
ncbi:MFS transporter [Planomonospora algeriensis]